MREQIRTKKNSPPEGEQFKFETRSAVGNNNHTAVETRQ